MNCCWIVATGAVVCVGLTHLAVAQTSNLDAPISTQPTMRSEIKRGEAVAFDCGLHHLTDYSGFTDCVSRALDANEQKQKKSDPFVLGLSIGALAQAGIMAPNEHAGWVTVWRDDAALVQKKYRLSINDLCSAFAMKCETVKRIVGLK
jgi:hypothetical protein